MVGAYSPVERKAAIVVDTVGELGVFGEEFFDLGN
jgi:hypothetical protein